MAAAAQLLAHIHRLVAPSAEELGSDAALLRRFIGSRDHAAFAALVARHGPMVLRLCRRVLGDVHAAEDACQAAFLVLTRKAAYIRDPEMLAAWLHGVAYRLALKARAVDARRRQVEMQRVHFGHSPATNDPLSEVSARELLTILDAELQQLPDRYRLPLILCCLEGRSQPEAARLLGWSPGSVKGRLERGRAKLQQRLLRRGLTVSAALLALQAVQGNASGHLPALLSAAILRAVSATETAGEISTAVLALAEHGMRRMLPVQWRMVSALVLLAASLAVGGVAATHHAESATPVPEDQPPNATSSAASNPSQVEKVRTDRYGDPLPEGALARLGTARFRQAVATDVVVFLPDGKLIACAARCGRGVCLWDAATGKLVRQFGSRTHANALAISPDGKVLACAIQNPGKPEISLYETATGRKITDLAHDVILMGNTLVYAPDGKTIAMVMGSGSAIHFYDASTGKKRKTEVPSGQDVICRLAWSPDSKKLAWRGQTGAIHLWDADKGEEIGQWKGQDPDDEIFKGGCIAFAPDGKTLATGGRDQLIRLWDFGTHREKHRLDGKHKSIHAVLFSRDGRMLASGHRDGTIALWDAAKGEEIRRWQAHDFPVLSLDFSPDGKTLVSGAGWECGPRLWDVATGAEVRPFGGHTAVVERVLFSQNGQHLLSVGRDKNILDWDLTSGRETLSFRLPFHGANRAFDHCRLSPRGNRVASWSFEDDSIHLWDVATAKECAVLGKYKNSNKETGFEAALEFSPDGRLLAVGTKEGEIAVWDVAGTPPRRLRQEKFPIPSPIFCVAFSRDSTKLAVGVTRGFITIDLGEAASGQKGSSYTNTKKMVDRMVFSADGKMVATVTWRAKDPPQLWDTATGRLIQTLSPGLHIDGFYDVAFSPDGKWLAGTGAERDEKIHVWELITGLEVRTFRGHISTGVSIAFSPDGRTIASGGEDSSVLLWDFTGRVKAGRLPAAKWTPRELEKRWIDLASTAGPQAVQALWDLIASPDQALPLLRQRIKPVEPVDEQRVERLIRELDSENFEMRTKATEELETIVDGAEPTLRKKLAGQASPEIRQRIKQVLSKLEPSASPERLRALRAILVLEYTGTAEAREHLRALAKGVPDVRLTREATASLERLDRQHNAKP